jgi:hypothetical protein
MFGSACWAYSGVVDVISDRKAWAMAVGIVVLLVAAVGIIWLWIYTNNRPVPVDNPVGTIQVDTFNATFGALPIDEQNLERDRIVGQVWRIVGVERFSFSDDSDAWVYTPSTLEEIGDPVAKLWLDFALARDKRRFIPSDAMPVACRISGIYGPPIATGPVFDVGASFVNEVRIKADSCRIITGE